MHNESSEPRQQDAFDLFKAYFMSWFLPLLLTVGFWGTSVNLLIIVKYKVFQKTTSILFSALAVADLVNLIFAATYLYLSVYWDFDPMRYSATGCHLVPYLEAIGYWLSPWIQAMISCHRMLAIRYPLRIRQWLTAKQTGRLVTAVAAVVVAYALVIPACHRWTPRRGGGGVSGNISGGGGGGFHCDKEAGKFLVYYSHGLFGSIAPFFVMVLCTGLIVYFVCQSRNDVVLSTFQEMSAAAAASAVSPRAGGERRQEAEGGGGGGFRQRWRRRQREARDANADPDECHLLPDEWLRRPVSHFQGSPDKRGVRVCAAVGFAAQICRRLRLPEQQHQLGILPPVGSQIPPPVPQLARLPPQLAGQDGQ